MTDFIILALALNFFWLPFVVNFLLDSLNVIGGNPDRFNKVMLRYGTGGENLRVKVLSWLSVPLGWLIAAYLLTEKTGCKAVIHLADC